MGEEDDSFGKAGFRSVRGNLQKGWAILESGITSGFKKMLRKGILILEIGTRDYWASFQGHVGY